jgi:hypothetical protein
MNELDKLKGGKIHRRESKPSLRVRIRQSMPLHTSTLITEVVKGSGIKLHALALSTFSQATATENSHVRNDLEKCVP